MTENNNSILEKLFEETDDHDSNDATKQSEPDSTNNLDVSRLFSSNVIMHDEHEKYMEFHHQHFQFLEEIKNLNDTIQFLNANITIINKRIEHLRSKNEKFR